MKKILMLLLCLTVFTGCRNDTPKDNNDNKTSDNSITDNNTNNNDNTNNDWYTRFESGLKDKNITYTSKDTLDATSIGGVEGYRYVTENGNIDVYRYEDSDDYDRIVKDKKLGNDGRKVEVNGHMIIVSDGLSEDVLGVFRGLK